MVRRTIGVMTAGLAAGLFLGCQQQQVQQETQPAEQLDPYAARTLTFSPGKGVSEVCRSVVNDPKKPIRICFDQVRSGGTVEFTPRPASSLGPSPDRAVSLGEWGFELTPDDTLAFSGLVRVTVEARWSFRDRAMPTEWEESPEAQRLFRHGAPGDPFQDITISSKFRSPAELDGGFNRPSAYIPGLDRRDARTVIAEKRRRLAEALSTWQRTGLPQDLIGVVAAARTLWFSEQIEDLRRERREAEGGGD